MHAQLLPTAAAFRRPAIAAARPAAAAAAWMQLHAVREGGQVVDFVWDGASSAAAHLLHCAPEGLPGQRLHEVVAAVPLDLPALFDRYRRVLEHGNAQSFDQVHEVEGREDIVIHRVVPVGDGLNVTLTNLSADRRAQTAHLQVDALQAVLRRKTR